ncbi:MAG: FkbM family methyltransferase [Lachnospiraceae bacterium]|nr:FkbM family methyltransferase [Lachnospiraceae bacterium]
MQNIDGINNLLLSIGRCKRSLVAKGIFVAQEEYRLVLTEWSSAMCELTEQIYGVLPKYTEQFCAILDEAIGQKASLENVYAVYEEWESICTADLNMLSQMEVELDCEFERMLLALTRCTEERLVERLIRRYRSHEAEDAEIAEIMRNCYARWSHLWGTFDPADDNWEHFRLGVADAKAHTAEYLSAYVSLEDYRSKKVLYGILKFRLELDFAYKESLRENSFSQYFDLDICVGDKKDAVYVDCGAYNGESALDFLKNYSAYKRMYLYEMVPSCIKEAQDNLCAYENIVYWNAGVGSKEQAGNMIKMQDFVGTSASIQEGNVVYNPVARTDVAETDMVEVPLVALDQDIKEPISFLKMDIEGSELDAIAGAEEHICADKSILAICTYHHYEHLWEVMQEIKRLRPDYKFYMRFYGNEGSVAESEHVLYAV